MLTGLILSLAGWSATPALAANSIDSVEIDSESYTASSIDTVILLPDGQLQPSVSATGSDDGSTYEVEISFSGNTHVLILRRLSVCHR